MPQGKLKVKARMPPKTAAKQRVKTVAQRKGLCTPTTSLQEDFPLRLQNVYLDYSQSNTSIRGCPMKAKNPSFGQKEFLKSEKVLVKKIEQELRSRATSDGKSTSTTGVKGSELHSATSSGVAVSKATAVKQVLRKFK